MKREIRKKYIDVRKQIINKEEKSKVIVNQIMNHQKYIDANIIACYCSLKDEVCLDELITDAWKNKKIVVVPKVNGNKMEFYEIKNMNDLEIQSFGIREPKHDFTFDKHKIDLFFVPGVAFDIYGNRMGFGKGYYDRYLVDLDAYKIGICFREQLDDHIPTDEFDIKMNEIIVD